MTVRRVQDMRVQDMTVRRVQDMTVRRSSEGCECAGHDSQEK